MTSTPVGVQAMRTDFGRPSLALLRKVALNFARANTTLKASLKGKRKSAAWDNDFMATLIAR